METITGFYLAMHFIMIPVGTMEGEMTCGVDLGGFYQPQSVYANTAYICEGLSSTEELRVKFHETGHYIWFNRLSKVQREEWEKLYKQNRFVSEYARKNAVEDFAETYSAYMMGKRSLNVSQKNKYLRNLIIWK